jgi:hypothetical protein
MCTLFVCHGPGSAEAAIKQIIDKAGIRLVYIDVHCPVMNEVKGLSAGGALGVTP